MRLGHVEIFVSDSTRARDFYTDVLGFEVTEEQGPYVWLRLGSQEVLLRPGRQIPAAQAYDAVGIALVFYTDDLARTAQELESRGLSFGMPDGADGCLTFSDPDGNWFQLVNPGESHG